MENKGLSFDDFIKKNNINLKYCVVYLMCHRGGLKESLKTKICIYDLFYKDTFLNCIKDLYEYYCFDERINCYRFIMKDMKIFNPTWLLLEIRKGN